MTGQRMPFLNIPAHERFFGLRVEGDELDINSDETPDSRNDCISEEGELSTRPGIAKQNITAVGNPIMEIGFLKVTDVVTQLFIVWGSLQKV